MEQPDLQETLRQMDTPDMHETMLRAQWPDFAGFAYAGFLNEGRGAMVVDLKRGVMTENGLLIPSFYAAEGSDKLARLGGWPSPEIAEAVRDYDPELDVVFLVWRLNDEIFHYVASDELTPRQAYEKRC
jgi:hypothetical protein